EGAADPVPDPLRCLKRHLARRDCSSLLSDLHVHLGWGAA
ncbi:MAG: hypothetical protein QOF55_1787, partial [Thermoleophilaceae bacterium]|nr:hypothetical protein [Thermoleophilaceae bacterium]